MKNTELETIALKALWESAKGNGHDFGMIEDLRAVLSPSQIGGVVSSLVKKDIITVHDTITNDSGTWTQFTWNHLVEGYLVDADGNLTRKATLEDILE